MKNLDSYLAARCEGTVHAGALMKSLLVMAGMTSQPTAPAQTEFSEISESPARKPSDWLSYETGRTRHAKSKATKSKAAQ